MMRLGFATKLSTIALLALVLRLLGTTWGEPYEYHFDEPFVLKPALRMVENGDPNPHFFRYPSLLIYLESIVVSANNAFGAMPLGAPNDPSYGPQDLYPDTWPALFGGRHLVAALGTLGVVAVGLVARATGGEAAGLFAALVLAVLPLHVEHSHYLTTDVPASTFLAFALAAAVAGTGWAGTVCAGIAAGLAASTKYTAALVLPILAVLLVVKSRGQRRRWLLRVSVLLATACAAFALTTPYAWIDTTSFLADIGIVKTHYTTGHLGAEGTANWSWYLLRLYQDGLGGVGMAWLCVGGALVAWDLVRASRTAGRNRDVSLDGSLHALVLLISALAWFCWLGSVRVRFERNLLPIVVIACAVAGHGWGALVNWFRTRNVPLARFAAGGVVLALVAPAMKTGSVIEKLSMPDTRTVAVQWIEQNLRHGTSMVREEYTPQPDGSRYRVRYVWSLAVQDVEDFRANGVDYVIASQAIYGRVLQDKDPHMRAMAERYRRIFALPKAASFVPGRDMSGPAIEIFEIPQSSDDGNE